HAALRDVIGRSFDMLKQRFTVLTVPPEHSLEMQVRIPSALCAIHNVVRTHDPRDVGD
ncbi:hypothetical protein BV22DRAFT_970619, partial [Leucogyrophana mollusca]